MVLWPALYPDAQKQLIERCCGLHLGANPCTWMLAVVRKGTICVQYFGWTVSKKNSPLRLRMIGCETWRICLSLC